MTESIKRYQEELCRQSAGFFPTWLPGDRIDPGDVGVLVSGRFRRSTSLKELGISFELDQPGSPQSLRYWSTQETSFDFGASASVADPSAEIASASAQVNIKFGAEGAFLFHADGVMQMRLKNRVSVQEEIIQLTKRKRWESRWYLVEEVYRADCATIIVCQGQSASVSLAVKGNLTIGSLSLADPNLNIAVVRSNGLIFHVIGSRDVRPLYACSKIAGGWLRDRYLTAVRGESSSEEVRLQRARVTDLLSSW